MSENRKDATIYARAAGAIVVALLGTALAPAAGQAQSRGEAARWLDGFQVHGTVEVGGMPQSVDSSSSKFEEYRDLPGGWPVLPRAQVQGSEPERGYYFELSAEDAAEQDGRYVIRAGEIGRLEIEAGWDQIPHKLSKGARTLYRRRGDDLFLDDDIRRSVSSDNALLPTVLELARAHGLRLREDTGWVDVRLTPRSFLTFKAHYRAERQRGTRAIGTASAFSAGANTLELPEPLEYVTHTVGASGEYATRSLMLRFIYGGSVFRNPYAVLEWDNPLALEDAPNAFSTGRLAREPDNQAHEFRLEGRAVAPLRTVMAGSFSYGFRSQNDNLLPLTSNTALFDPPLSPLAANKLDGWVDIINASYRITAEPIENVTLAGRARYYDFGDRSRRLAIADPVIADSLVAGDPRKDPRFSYSKESLGAGVSWRPLRQVRGGIDYDWVRWHRENREVKNSDENTVRTSLGATPLAWLTLAAAYTHAIRDPGSYEAGAVERSFTEGPSIEGAVFGLLRKYDLAHRQRDAVSVSLQASPWQRLAAGAAFELGADDYDRSVYGLLDDDTLSYSFDLTYSLSQRATLFADYTREEYRYNQRSRFRPLENVGDVQRAIDDTANDWRVRGHDSVDTVSVGATFNIVPNKLDVDLGYNFSFGIGRLKAGSVAGGELSGEAEDYPNVKNRLHQATLTLVCRLREDLKARLGYAFERYTESDFATDEIAPSMTAVDPGARLSAFLGARAPDYTAHIGSVALEYEF